MPFSSSAREPHNFIPELLLVFILQRLNSPEALCLLSASESHLREQPSFYCVVFSLFSLSPCILYLYSFGLTSFFLYSLFLSVVPSVEHRYSLWLRDWFGEGNTWSKTCISSLCCKDWVGAPAPYQNHWVTIFRAVEDRVGEAISWSKIVWCTGFWY